MDNKKTEQEFHMLEKAYEKAIDEGGQWILRHGKLARELDIANRELETAKNDCKLWREEAEFWLGIARMNR
jgi:hypothetical protein